MPSTRTSLRCAAATSDCSPTRPSSTPGSPGGTAGLPARRPDARPDDDRHGPVALPGRRYILNPRAIPTTRAGPASDARRNADRAGPLGEAGARAVAAIASYAPGLRPAAPMPQTVREHPGRRRGRPRRTVDDSLWRAARALRTCGLPYRRGAQIRLRVGGVARCCGGNVAGTVVVIGTNP